MKVYYYAGMMTEDTTIERITYYSQVPSGGVTPHHEGHTWKHQGWSGRRGSMGKVWLYCTLQGEGWIEAGKAGLGLAS